MFDHRDIDIGLFPGESEEELYRLTVPEHESADRDDRLHVLPEGLEEIAPGVFLAAILASVDPERLSGHDVVRYMQGQDRQVSYSNAGLYRGMGELAYACEPDTARRANRPDEFASEELQTALVRTRRSADSDLGLALDLRLRLQPVWEALDKGVIDLARAKVFAYELEVLNPDLIPAVVDEILHEAPELTTGQLRARLKKLVIATDPDTAEENFHRGIDERKVVTQANPDHTADFAIRQADPISVNTAYEHVNRLAMQLKRQGGESRTLDQIRSDVCIDLLSGHRVQGSEAVAGAQPKIVLQVTADAPTAHVPGYGPVLTRGLAAHLGGNSDDLTVETVSDAEAGRDLNDCDHHTTGRRPTATQVDHVRSRYPTCIFPECVWRQTSASSTTAVSTRGVVRPSVSTWHRYADITTYARTRRTGSWSGVRTAVTPGPAPSVTPTPRELLPRSQASPP